MARMLGRCQVPGCCAGTRAGLPPGLDCAGGGTMTARYAKRMGARQLAAEIADELHPQPDLDWLATLGPLYDLTDCRHGCNGSPCGGEQCTFTCHPAWRWIDCPACGNDPEERKTCRVCRGSGQIGE